MTRRGPYRTGRVGAPSLAVDPERRGVVTTEAFRVRYGVLRLPHVPALLGEFGRPLP